MPQDRFDIDLHMLGAPAETGFAITPADGDDLPAITRALYVGTGGDLSVTMKSGTVLVFKGVLSGAILPLRVARVRVTDTTAEDILGLC